MSVPAPSPNRDPDPGPGRKPFPLLVVGIVVAVIGLLVALDGGAGWIRHRLLRGVIPAVVLPPTDPKVLPPPAPTEDQADARPVLVAQAPDRAPGAEAPRRMPRATPTTALGPEPSVTVPMRNAIANLGHTDFRRPAADDLFADCYVPHLRIELREGDLRQLARKPRDYVLATVYEGPVTYTNVGVHLKGGPGSYRSLDDQPSFTLNFDKFAEHQTFHGLKKLHLNSSVQDASYLSEKICRELFEAAGVPAPQAGHARVTFNERAMGLYVLVEGVNKQFLKRHFTDATGNVYDGHSGTDVQDKLPTNSGDNPSDHRGLRALAAAIRVSNPKDRWTQIQRTLDVDRFLSFVAMEAMLGHWDGYTVGRNNYRIFHDLQQDRMVFLPQGLDQVLNESQAPIIPRLQGLVARAVLEIPEARARYLSRVAELATNVFQPEAITQRIQEVTARVQAALRESDPTGASAQAQKARGLLRRFQKRADFLRRQFAPVATLAFDHSAHLPLTNWTAQIDLGEAALIQESADDGTATLRIATVSGCTASWRTTVALDAGKYRLEGRIRTRGVVFPENDPRAGAGFRVSRHRVGQKNAGDRAWTPITFDFEMPKDQSEIELVCELRADQGEIAFDLASLRLARR